MATHCWYTAPIFLPGASHGQGSLASYSPRGHREPDRTERLSNNMHLGFCWVLAPRFLETCPPSDNVLIRRQRSEN